MNLPNHMRDHLLDFYKGIAITIVVLGHTYQHFYPDTFFNEIGYKLIGAMQMPFFVFLSGATAAIWIGAYDLRKPLQAVEKYFFKRVGTSAFRLLLPFCSWTVIGFLVGHWSDANMHELWGAFQRHFWIVFHDPMYSLWFLLCIFYCILGWCLIQMFLAVPVKLIKPVNQVLDRCNLEAQIWIQLAFSFFLWILFRKINPRIFGTWFFDDYFFYFILGVAFYAAIQINKKHLDSLEKKLFSSKLAWLPYVVFALLAPFWALTADNNLEPYAFDYHGKGYANLLYRFVVATAGIYATLDISRRIYFLNHERTNAAIAYLGKMSLGIYAMHTYFLNLYPPVIAPLLISVGASFLILQIPVLREMFLGERGKV